MRHPIQSLGLLATSLLLLLGGCARDISLDPTTQSTLSADRVVRVSASIQPTATRASIDLKEGSLDLAVKLTPQDLVKVYIRQGEVLESLAPVGMTAVSPDGKVCHFDIKVPTSIDVSKPATLIAVSGKDPAFISEGRVYLRTRQFYTSNLSEVRPPLAMVVRDCLLRDHPQLSATFEHLGFYTVSRIRNTGKYTMQSVWLTLTDDKYERPWIGGVRAVEGKKNVYMRRFLDLESGELSYQEDTNGADYEHLPTLAPGEETTLYAFEIADPYAREHNLFRAVADYLDGDRFYLSTSNVLPHPGISLTPGSAYYLYITTDGDRMSFTGASGAEIKAGKVLSIDLGELGAKPRIDLEASPVQYAYIDLNGNGTMEKDNDELIVEGGNFFIPSQPIISLYGDIKQIALASNQIQRATLPEGSPVVDLDLRYNQMTAEALDELMRSLPSYKWSTPPLLRIMGNPGVASCHPELAQERGWVLDVPVTDKSQPHLTICRDGNQYNTSTYVGVILDAPESVRSQCWVDTNNNGRRDPGEEISEWGLSVIHDYLPTGGVLTLYGPLEKVSFLSDRPLGEIYENTITTLRMLEIPPVGPRVDIRYELLSMVEYLKVGRTDWPRWSERVDLHAYESLKYLIMTRSVVGNLTLPADGRALLHLDLSEADVWRIIGLSMQSDLETLLLGRYSVWAILGRDDERNKVMPQTLEQLGSLKRVSAIGCDLSGQAIAQLLNALPDRTGKEPGKIRLANNPGLGFVDLSIATRKNWKVDTGTTSTTGFGLPSMGGNDW